MLQTSHSRERAFGSPRRLVAPVGQGSWKIEDSSASAAVAAMRRGLDLGLTHVDTAEMYGSGSAEKIVAEAITGRRDEVFLVSKVLPGNASKRGTLAACEKSLARLRTDRLDCYLLHWRGAHPLRFLLRHPEVFVIPKASNVAHVEENAGAAALDLSEAELTRIDAAFPLGTPPRRLPMI
jgi:diketogulonate reductase-like aldo/keto reductase